MILRMSYEARMLRLVNGPSTHWKRVFIGASCVDDRCPHAKPQHQVITLTPSSLLTLQLTVTHELCRIDRPILEMVYLLAPTLHFNMNKQVPFLPSDLNSSGQWKQRSRSQSFNVNHGLPAAHCGPSKILHWLYLIYTNFKCKSHVSWIIPCLNVQPSY